MKKNYPILLFFVLLLCGCANQVADLDFNIKDVDKITIFSGTAGEQVEIVNDEQIDHITNNLNNLSFIKDKSSKGYDGFLYNITLYDSNEEKIDDIIIMNDNRISYNDYFYYVADNDKEIDIGYLDGVFEFVEAGLYYSNNNSEPTPWLATAVKTKKIQESVVNFIVYTGYTKGFIDKWNNDAWESNPGYGKFAVERVICDRSGMEISSHIYPLNDFEDENKYSVQAVCTMEGTDTVTFRDFSFHFEDEFHLDEIPIEQGYIFYRIILVDENNQIIVANLKCGISAIDLYFKKVDNQITFSLYDSIFYE